MAFKPLWNSHGEARTDTDLGDVDWRCADSTLDESVFESHVSSIPMFKRDECLSRSCWVKLSAIMYTGLEEGWIRVRHSTEMVRWLINWEA